MKPLLIGECNPYGHDPYFALYPFPAQASGDRLRRILGLCAYCYLDRFDRQNLCAGAWSSLEAHRTASAIVTRSRGGVLVLLGRKVALAFGVRTWTPFTVAEVDDRTLVFLPHPSGRCRIWSDSHAVHLARMAIHAAGVNLLEDHDEASRATA